MNSALTTLNLLFFGRLINYLRGTLSFSRCSAVTCSTKCHQHMIFRFIEMFEGINIQLCETNYNMIQNCRKLGTAVLDRLLNVFVSANS